jgi:S-adenosyl-L-methionine hydrolase (adenosine-forming)
MRRITLLTDFGTRDGYVGAVKGILATQAPSALVEDISHDLPPGDIRKGSLVLGRYWLRYPPGTVHLTVVDPGVGTGRRALALQVEGHFHVAPDNGVLSQVLNQTRTWRCVSLVPAAGSPPPESRTFHGRDVFAPAAARLAAGTPLEELGPEVTDPVRHLEPRWRKTGEWLVGEVVEEDRFGNLATNLPEEMARLAGGVEAGEYGVPFRDTYGDAREGELLALRDSEGRVEIAVRGGSAADRLRMGVGGVVRISLRPTTSDQPRRSRVSPGPDRRS